MSVIDFSFADHATDFDAHIGASIPSYDRLRWWCEKLSRRFIQNRTRVIDIGCSTGALLKSIREANQASRAAADYLGIDIAPSFEQHWCKLRAENLRFEARDALSFDGAR